MLKIMKKLIINLCCILIICLLNMQPAYSQEEFVFSFSDNFEEYKQGSDGSPYWSTVSMAWEIRSNSFINNDVNKSFAILENAPYGSKQVIETTIKIHKPTGNSWKVAGIAIYNNDANYWHLALVEKPEDMGKGHFIELAEMYNGAWVANWAPETALLQSISSNTELNWKYNHPYKLRIELNQDSISGFVSELDGRELSKLGFEFNHNKAVKYGKPALDNSGFEVSFDNFSSKIKKEIKMPIQKKKIPAYQSKGWEEIKGEKTGFFHVEEKEGKWWVIDPEGNAFYIIGTDHVNYNVHWCEKLGYAPYHRNCKKIYRTEEKWADSAVSRLLSWNFNSLGAGSSQSVRHKGLAHTDNLGMGAQFAQTHFIIPRTTWIGFPDVFNPKFKIFCEKLAKRKCTPNKDNPWLIGYFIDNELEWHQWTTAGIFEETFKRDSDHHAKKALVKMFRKKYRDVDEFNKYWLTDITSFKDLLNFKEAPAIRNKKARQDKQDFLRLVAEKYFSITTAAIKKYDPNHMILGCRFAGRSPGIFDIAGQYSDIISVNCYRKVDLKKKVISDGFEKELAEWYKEAKRPFMITEWSFPALDAGLPCKHGAGQRVPTQKDRALAFNIFQEFLFSTPYMVGSNFFMWVDEPELGISTIFPEDSNYGLVNVNDEPYQELTEAAKKLNAKVYSIHK